MPPPLPPPTPLRRANNMTRLDQLNRDIQRLEYHNFWATDQSIQREYQALCKERDTLTPHRLPTADELRRMDLCYHTHLLQSSKERVGKVIEGIRNCRRFTSDLHIREIKLSGMYALLKEQREAVRRERAA